MTLRAGSKKFTHSSTLWDRPLDVPFPRWETKIQAVRLSVQGCLAVFMLASLFGEPAPEHPHPPPAANL